LENKMKSLGLKSRAKLIGNLLNDTGDKVEEDGSNSDEEEEEEEEEETSKKECARAAVLLESVGGKT
jgi:hypothetical protein